MEIHFDLPAELIVLGSPEMIETVVWTSASSDELQSVPARAYPKVPRTEFFRQIDVGVRMDSDNSKAFGTIRLQALPIGRTLMRLWVPDGSQDPDRFRAFCGEFLTELARLGFFEAPDVRKDPLGFRSKAERRS